MKICMLLHKSIEHDSRVQREARALAESGHEVTVVHLAADRGARQPRPYALRSAALPIVRRRVWLLGRLLEAANMVKIAAALDADAVHAHDAAMLAPGYLAARRSGAKLVYDSHELATGVPYRSGPWSRLVAAIERLIVPRCDDVITVSHGIAARLRELYSLDSIPRVVRNLPDLPPPAESPEIDLHRALGVDGAPLVLHQGAVAADRGCDVLIRAMSELPNAHLLFLGADGQYADYLQTVAGESGLADRVHFRPAVRLSELLSYTAQADVGVSLLRGNCENHRLALPNKVFEYVAAGVPVVASALPELRALIEANEIGVTVDPEDPAAVAAGLRVAVEERRRFADGARVARRALSWATERERLLEAYRELAAPAGEADGRPSAVVLVRNPAGHDGRVLRAARALRHLEPGAVVLGVTSTEQTSRLDQVEGVTVVRLQPRSPFEMLARLRRRFERYAAGVAANSGADAGPAQGVTGTARRANDAPSEVPEPLLRAHRLLRTLDYYRRGIGALRAWRPRLVHCCDYNTMWIGIAGRIAFRCSVVYDAHELWPDRNQRSEPRWWLLLCEALFVRAADRVTATSPGHAAVIARRYKVREPTVIRNIPESRAAVRPAADVDRLLAVYVGAVTTNRGLEQCLDALSRLDDLRLRIVGPGRGDYRACLAAQARRLGLDNRVEIADPVAPGAVSEAIAGAGVGLALIQPSCLSYAESLPNKLFEYVAGGVPVLASDLPVLGRFVTERGIGLVASPTDSADIAAKLRALTEPAANDAYREATARAGDELDGGLELSRLSGVYEQLLDEPIISPRRRLPR